MGATKIEWATHTWNPVTGCTKVSEGCRHCYAERQVHRFGRPGPETVPGVHPVVHDFRVMLHPDRLDQPLHWHRPRRVFVCSMSDLFHEAVPFDFTAAVFGMMAGAPRQHTFLVLTKRPRRMADFFEWARTCAEKAIAGWCPDDDVEWATLQGIRTSAMTKVPGIDDVPAGPYGWPLHNVWLGVSVENQETADERIPLLLQTPAARRFVSCEPMLGPISLPPLCDLSACRDHGAVNCDNATCPARVLDWVICGGESGPKARPMHPDWARSMRDQCQAAGVPFFMKQMHVFRCPVCGTCSTAMPEWNAGECDECTERARRVLSKEPEEWPEDLRIREVPSAQG